MFKPLEINPRLPDTLPLTVAAGIDMPKRAAEELVGRRLPDGLMPFKELMVVRFWTEHYFDPANGRRCATSPDLGRVRRGQSPSNANLPADLGLEGGVSSASVLVSITPPIAIRLSRLCNWAPPAMQARPPITFWLRRAAAWAVMYSKAMKRDSSEPEYDVGGDAADLRIGEMARHAAQRQRFEQHVGAGDHDRLGPALLEDQRDAVVERVRLALPPLSRRRWKTEPGYCATFARITSGVWSVLASSTT